MKAPMPTVTINLRYDEILNNCEIQPDLTPREVIRRLHEALALPVSPMAWQVPYLPLIDTPTRDG